MTIALFFKDFELILESANRFSFH